MQQNCKSQQDCPGGYYCDFDLQWCAPQCENSLTCADDKGPGYFCDLDSKMCITFPQHTCDSSEDCANQGNTTWCDTHRHICVPRNQLDSGSLCEYSSDCGYLPGLTCTWREIFQRHGGYFARRSDRGHKFFFRADNSHHWRSG